MPGSRFCLQQVSWSKVTCLQPQMILCMVVSAVYVFSGNPYDTGSLDPVQIVVQKGVNKGLPFAAVGKSSRDFYDLSSKSHFFLVYSPRDEGEYAAVFFAGGLYSYMPVTGYHDILSAISSHGFVVIGIELFQYPNVSLESESGNDAINSKEPDKFFEELDWVHLFH